MKKFNLYCIIAFCVLLSIGVVMYLVNRHYKNANIKPIEEIQSVEDKQEASVTSEEERPVKETDEDKISLGISKEIGLKLKNLTKNNDESASAVDNVVSSNNAPLREYAEVRDKEKENTSLMQIQVEENLEVQANNAKQKTTIKDRVKKLLAFDLTDFSSDKKILEALALLQNSGYSNLIEEMGKNSVRIKFSDMSMVPYNNKTCHAATMYKNYSNNIILINSKYLNLPAEEIACLIVHEMTHLNRKNDVATEVMAIKNEAKCWTILKDNQKTYPNNRLTKRLDYVVEFVKEPEEVIVQRLSRTDIYKESLENIFKKD